MSASHKSLRGKLLVAPPTLRDPNFNRTVVYLIEHTIGGAVGVVLNRAGLVGVEELLPPWQWTAAAPAVFFTGGPVGRGGLIGLGIDADGDVVVVDLTQDPDDVGVKVVRIFDGHSGWTPGQLEAEVGLGGWFVLDATPNDVVDEEPDDLHRRVLRRQGGKYALMSNSPADLRLN